MQRRFTNVLIATCVLALPVAAAAEDYKIGVVNAVRVLEEAPQAEQARKRLETEFASRDRELVAAQKVLKQKEDKLAKDGAIMSEGERKNLERDILAEKRELKRDQDEFRDDLNFRRNEEFGQIQRQIVDAIQGVAKEKKYDLIVSEGVIYASDRVDVTEEVIKRLKQNYKQ